MICLIICLLHFVTLTFAHGDYGSILAEQLNQYCEAREHSTSAQAPRIGKSGPRGLPGPAGPPGEVNYTLVEEMITERLEVFAKSRQTDCSQVSRETAKRNNESGGVFDIYLGLSGRQMEVYCDLMTDGGGWTVFQRRMGGTVNFKRNWDEYVHGFGKPEHEFWIGLERLHRLASGGNYELRIDIEDWAGRKGYALYTIFLVGDASTKYRLKIGGYSGTAGDSLSYHSGQKFSTPDQDNDSDSSNCAEGGRGAWWYKSCHYSNLNGEYSQATGKYATGGNAYGVEWYHWNNAFYYSMKFVEMKVRPKY